MGGSGGWWRGRWRDVVVILIIIMIFFFWGAHTQLPPFPTGSAVVLDTPKPSYDKPKLMMFPSKIESGVIVLKKKGLFQNDKMYLYV